MTFLTLDDYIANSCSSFQLLWWTSRVPIFGRRIKLDGWNGTRTKLCKQL